MIVSVYATAGTGTPMICVLLAGEDISTVVWRERFRPVLWWIF